MINGCIIDTGEPWPDRPPVQSTDPAIYSSDITWALNAAQRVVSYTGCTAASSRHPVLPRSPVKNTDCNRQTKLSIQVAHARTHRYENSFHFPCGGEWFLPRDAFLARYMLLSYVCLSVSPLSVVHRQTFSHIHSLMPNCSIVTLVIEAKYIFQSFLWYHQMHIKVGKPGCRLLGTAGRSAHIGS